MAERKASKAAALEIAPVQTTTAVFAILGKRPVILNRLSEKTRGKKLRRINTALSIFLLECIVSIYEEGSGGKGGSMDYG